MSEQTQTETPIVELMEENTIATPAPVNEELKADEQILLDKEKEISADFAKAESEDAEIIATKENECDNAIQNIPKEETEKIVEKEENKIAEEEKVANKGLINQTGAYLEADAFTDVNDFKKSVNKQLQATLMKQQRENQYNAYINRANSNMLQEIFDNLPPYSQDDIRSVFGAEDINFNDFAWNSDLKGFTNGVILVKVKSNSDGNYEEDTMTASRL